MNRTPRRLLGRGVLPSHVHRIAVVPQSKTQQKAAGACRVHRTQAERAVCGMLVRVTRRWA